MGSIQSRQRTSTAPGHVLVQCGKIALVLRLIWLYPVITAWAAGRSGMSELVLLSGAVTFSLVLLLAWERVAPTVLRHPLIMAGDITLALGIFAIAGAPESYVGYLASTAVLIGLLATLLGQLLLVSLLSSGYALIAIAMSEHGEARTLSVGELGLSIVLFLGLTYVGNVMSQLQSQVDRSVAHARESAAEAALGEERSRLARELHDSLVKSLEGIGLQAKAMKMRGVAEEEATRIEQGTSKAMNEARNLLTDLRDAAVPPLADSLEETIQEVQAMHPVTVDVTTDEAMTLPVETRYAAHKIMEEALMNAGRHSGGDKLICAVSSEDDLLELSVSDNGAGFRMKEARKAGHLGLVSMRERAEELGGSFHIKSREGRGTEVTVKLPLAAQEEMT